MKHNKKITVVPLILLAFVGCGKSTSPLPQSTSTVASSLTPASTTTTVSATPTPVPQLTGGVFISSGVTSAATIPNPMNGFKNVNLDFGTPAAGAYGTMLLDGPLVAGVDYELVIEGDHGHTIGTIPLTVSVITDAGRSVGIGSALIIGSQQYTNPNGTGYTTTFNEFAASSIAPVGTIANAASRLSLKFVTGTPIDPYASYDVCAAMCAYLHPRGTSVPVNTCNFVPQVSCQH